MSSLPGEGGKGRLGGAFMEQKSTPEKRLRFGVLFT